MGKLGVGTGFGAVAAIVAVLMLVPTSSAGSVTASVGTVGKGGGLGEAARGLELPGVTTLPVQGEFLGERTLGGGPATPGAPSTASSARPHAAVVNPTSPQLLSEFAGLNRANSHKGLPADSQVAQNGSYVYEIVNNEYRITSTNGSKVYAKGTTNSIWGLNVSDNVRDVQVLFDLMSKRWFVAADDFTINYIEIAVSKTSSPTGAYYLYAYHVAISAVAQFMDEPQIGVSGHYFAVGTNQFNTTTSAFLGSTINILSKGGLTSGHQVEEAFGSTSIESFVPARGVTSNGSGTDRMFVATTVSSGASTRLDVLQWSGTVGSLVEHAYVFSIANTGLVPSASQPGTSTLLGTTDDRVQSVSYANQELWVAFSTACTPSGDSTQRSCVRVDAVNTFAMSLDQDADIGVAGSYLFFGAVTGLKVGTGYLMVLGFSGALSYPSIAVTGQNSTDNFGTHRGPVPVLAGTTYDSTGVFGSYSGIQFDPSSPAKTPMAWGASEYDISSGWATEVVHFSF